MVGAFSWYLVGVLYIFTRRSVRFIRIVIMVALVVSISLVQA